MGSSACRGIAEFIGSETRPGLVPVERFAATWGAAVLRPYGRRRQAGLDWGAGEPRLRMGEGYSSKAAARPPHSILGCNVGRHRYGLGAWWLGDRARLVVFVL